MSRAFFSVLILGSFVWAAGANSESTAPTAPAAVAAPAAKMTAGQPMSAPVPLNVPAQTVPLNNGAQATAPAVGAPGAVPYAQVQPYRTFIEVQRYTMENNGEPSSPISNVRIGVTFPNKSKLALPDAGQWWPIGNGQAQEIHRTYEIPFAFIQNDGFKFTIQMERKGSPMLPCEFDIVQLSQFNRAYTCHTDTAWQQNENIPADKLDKEGITIRVFTSKNSLPKEIPTDALAIR